MIRINRESNKHKKVPLFAGMSLIEKFIMITAPIGITFIIYTMSDFLEYVWWIRLCMSIGITIILWILIYFFAEFVSKRDWFT